MSAQDVEHIEITIDRAKDMIAKADALMRLKKNKDFQKVIEEGYLKDEAVRLVHLKGHPNAMRDKEMMASIEKDIDAIGSLLQHFQVICMMADRAEQDIAAAEEEREAILAEDV